MNERMANTEPETVDVARLAGALLRRAWLIALAAAVCALLAYWCITPKCETSVMFYTQSAPLVDTYIVLLDTEEALRQIAEEADAPLRPAQLRRKIQTERLQAAELFRVTVADRDPGRMRRLAAAVEKVLPRQILGIVDAKQAIVVDTEEAEPTGRWENALMGFLAGTFLATLAVLLLEIRDDTLRSGADIGKVSPYPVLASVFDGGDDREELIRLRARLQHLIGRKTGRVIGICGASEEKTGNTAPRLAFSLSRQGRRVLLIHCNLRQFSAEASHGGLSGFLSGRSGTEELIHCCGIAGYERAFHVLSAGKNPPNPAELLGSERMERLLNKLRTVYDDIVLDLPPLGEAGDALVIAARTDGMLLTVDRGRCSRAALLSSLEQLQAVDAPILGIVEHY